MNGQSAVPDDTAELDDFKRFAGLERTADRLHYRQRSRGLDGAGCRPSAQGASDAGFDLQLSGHTHGGQFWPWNHFVRLQQPFTAGLHKLGAMWVYISRGTGYWGPPMRFGSPSEITFIRLTRAA